MALSLTMRQNLHDTLLSRPIKYKMTKKFNPDAVKHVIKKVYSRPLVPINNRRLLMLAELPPFKRVNKWVEPDVASTCVSRAVLEATCTARLDHLSRPFVRTLRAMRREKAHFGKPFTDLMNDRINMSLDTIYYHNVKSLMNIAKQKRKGRKISEPHIRNFETDGNFDRLCTLATPKRIFRPREGKKRKWRNIDDMDRTGPLATPLPRKCYKSPSQDTLLLRNRRRLVGAVAYKVTEETMKLTKIPDWRLVPPWIPPGISRGALKYEISDYIKKLAEPAARSQAVESDLRENAFEISPGALKYKATPRMLELAKPKERK